MFLTTLCYLEKEKSGDYLMLLRNKKKNDPSEGKWIGVGGKVEPGETPDECAYREIREETGLPVLQLRLRGVIGFHSDQWESEEMYLYSGIIPEDSRLPDCREGELHFVPKDQIKDLNLWEGDRIFLKKLMQGEENIRLSLRYEGDRLTDVREE